MKEKKYYIKNNPISKEKIQELLNIQKEQMDNLEIMLKPEIFNLLENWIRKENNILNTFIKENKTFEISNYVRRGEDLYNFIQNIPYRFDLKNMLPKYKACSNLY